MRAVKPTYARGGGGGEWAQLEHVHSRSYGHSLHARGVRRHIGGEGAVRKAGAGADVG